MNGKMKMRMEIDGWRKIVRDVTLCGIVYCEGDQSDQYYKSLKV